MRVSLLLVCPLVACADPSPATQANPGSDPAADSGELADTATDCEADPDACAEDTVTWEHDCATLGEGLDCGFVTVLADRDDPSGATIDLFVGRRPHTSTTNNGVLMFNFGGPGAPATPYLAWFASYLGEVGETYDVIAVDPRGVGGSAPLQCAKDGPALDAILDTLDGSADPAALQAMIDAQSAFLADCRESDPEVVDHMSLSDWADDLDDVRAAVGAPTLNYYGVSAGSALGLQYGERHPDRVGRFVLDSVVSPFGGWNTLYELQRAQFPTLVARWAEDCAADRTCPIAADPMGALEAVLDRAATDPLNVNGRPLNWGRAAYGVALYFYDEASWPALSDALAAAEAGDGSSLMSAADAYWGRTETEYDPGGVVFFNVECTDSVWSPTAEELSAAILSDEVTYGAGGGLTRLFATEGAWCGAFGAGVQAVDAPPTAQGAPPYLLLQGTGDGPTPYVGALAAQSTLVNDSPMVVVDSYTHGQLFASTCAFRHAERFLEAGTLPEDGVTCR